ncbi:hypothetical protein H8K33_08095 [Undibacterium amnicola]|uniref:Tox-PL-2 domain-containing protein n=1 Tax=Undibacterium amnicola TaxID=1834038 RepID=A0ABR6XPQ2_9BURK|nr:hypothetical protein [Undibacterium amnicola]
MTFTDVIYVNTKVNASYPFIVKESPRGDVISKEWNHYGVVLHNKVFSNHYPDGMQIDAWLEKFFYLNHLECPTHLTITDYTISNDSVLFDTVRF